MGNREIVFDVWQGGTGKGNGKVVLENPPGKRYDMAMTRFGEVLGGFSGKKGRWLLLAAIVAGFGFVLNTVDFSIPSKGPVAGKKEEVVSSDWRENSRTKVTIEQNTRTWGDAAMRLGLSFGIAMIAGSLLRACLKTTLTLFAITGVVLFVLYQQGMIEPFWRDYTRAAEEAKDWALLQKDAVSRFLKGYVPSTGAALIGFGFGLRK